MNLDGFKPLTQSTTFHSQVARIGTLGLGLLGYNAAPADVQAVVAAVCFIGWAITEVWTLIGRIRATKRIG